MKELQQICQEYNKLQEERTPAVLATLWEVQGSSYRSPGARALILPTEEIMGSISGGCIEEDLKIHARKVLSTGSSQVIHYDTTKENEILWGFGSGCKGMVDIHLQKVPREGQTNLFPFIEECLSLHKQGWMATLLSSENNLFSPGDFFLFPGKEAPSFLEEIWKKEICDLFSSKRWLIQNHNLPQGKMKILWETFRPISLLLLGVSPETAGLVEIASALGWHTTVADARSSLLGQKVFRGCHTVISPWKETASHLHFTDHTAVVISTHNYMADKELLKFLYQKPLFYLGMISSRARIQALLQDLEKEGFGHEGWKTLHSPAGLDLGNDFPQEIALSVASQIQAVFFQKKGGFMANKKVETSFKKG